ncbi:hypothetical protein ACFQJD_07700 [Haloplanus sp. GCM10025708]|uniref:hypothetical protein n=1 Tax=Haloferacaceae TaxID=1644056 RepID=UPI00361DEB92
MTYTLGIWLWVFCFPALFLAGYRRYGDMKRGAAMWLVGLPTVAMLGLTTYCRFFWPKLHPATWNAPAYTFVCWLYCSTYDVIWSNAAYLIALFGIVTTLLVVRHQDTDRYALLGFGFLALPLGLPALYGGYRRTARTAT